MSRNYRLTKAGIVYQCRLCVMSYYSWIFFYAMLRSWFLYSCGEREKLFLNSRVK